MSFVLPDLPYPKAAFPNIISSETFDYHYSKHHQAYVNNLNALVKGTEWEKQSLADIVVKYPFVHSDVPMSRSTTTQLSIGTTAFTGTAFLLTKLNLPQN